METLTLVRTVSNLVQGLVDYHNSAEDRNFVAIRAAEIEQRWTWEELDSSAAEHYLHTPEKTEEGNYRVDRLRTRFEAVAETEVAGSSAVG